MGTPLWFFLFGLAGRKKGRELETVQRNGRHIPLAGLLLAYSRPKMTVGCTSTCTCAEGTKNATLSGWLSVFGEFLGSGDRKAQIGGVVKKGMHPVGPLFIIAVLAKKQYFLAVYMPIKTLLSCCKKRVIQYDCKSYQNINERKKDNNETS